MVDRWVEMLSKKCILVNRNQRVEVWNDFIICTALFVSADDWVP